MVYCLQERHWKDISKVMGVTVEKKGDFTFEKVLEMGLMKHVDEIV